MKHWLTDLREKADIKTQGELAARLQLAGFNYTPAAVSHWENNVRQPPFRKPEFTRTLARILNVSETELLKAAGYKVERALHTDVGERIAYLVDGMPPDKQQIALRIIESLAE
ncbi:MAG: helix-turn-helix transcriptional regulator [bacterium]|nr:helix-turn-helix transcriptional regulator [bacterium]